MAGDLRAPFPWFGGKSRVASLVWERFGKVDNYVEPFYGSGAVLLGRPGWPDIGVETVNDKDGFVANFWRALQAAPDEVAKYADWPVNETDQHARHLWLVRERETLTQKLGGDPDFYDAKVAGWWVWGLSVWIGHGWCSGDGAWSADADGKLVHLGDLGRGVHRQRVHLGNLGQGVDGATSGVASTGSASISATDGLYNYFKALADRLRRVRVCSGDWTRVCGPTPTVKLGLTGVFLDPPYSGEADRTDDLYVEDSNDVAHEVRKWAIEWQDDPRMRIALCGYEGEHDLPGWTEVAWKAAGGYGSQGGADSRGRANAGRERIWFSPHCLKPEGRLNFDAPSDELITLPTPASDAFFCGAK